MTSKDIPAEKRGWVEETGKPPKGGPYVVTVAWATPAASTPNYWMVGYTYRLAGNPKEWRMTCGAHVSVLKRRREDERNGIALMATFDADGVEHSSERVLPSKMKAKPKPEPERETNLEELLNLMEEL
jgi:hypothetical protein